MKVLENWFTSKEIEDLITENVQESINNCTSPKDKTLIFNAFDGLNPEDVKVLIIGQDPYPDTDRAHGLAFSFWNADEPKDSLANIFNKIKNDLGIENKYTNLTAWKKQGVLLLNTSLTFNPDLPTDVGVKTWKNFIMSVMKKLIEVKTKTNQPLVIMLWGGKANKFKMFDNNPLFKVIRSSHPSRNFGACNKEGSVPAFNNMNHKQFKECNEFLEKHGVNPVDWRTYEI